MVEVGFVPAWEIPEVDIPEGEVRSVDMPDGSRVLVRKLEPGFDTADPAAAWMRLRGARAQGEFLTGLFHLRTGLPTLDETLELVDEPLASLPPERLRPSKAALDEVMESLK